MNLKKLIGSIKKTILAVACVHIVLLGILAATSGNLVYLDLANILDLKLFFPHFEYNIYTRAFGAIIILILLVFNYRE